MTIEFKNDDYPPLYLAADQASLTAQRNHYLFLLLYLLVLVVAAFVSFQWPNKLVESYVSLMLFLGSIALLAWSKHKKYDEDWYNGRAVAESVKTRTWRWIMNAEPYQNDEDAARLFIEDLKGILNQQTNLSQRLTCDISLAHREIVSEKMLKIRKLDWKDRLALYRKQRVEEQAIWYSNKSTFNKQRALFFFIFSVILHASAIAMLIYRINNLQSNLPIAVVATAAGALLTWTQAKKYDELRNSYSLTAHEIYLMKGDVSAIKNNSDVSDFVVNSEAAFSREHTQWVARKNS
ncbi:DUF4231 domain-containing protein [Vibrio fluvialis]|nr:DUF4231 domain-containing protein [Vibrio fluvialis]